jgi:hypothetical protein
MKAIKFSNKSNLEKLKGLGFIFVKLIVFT